MKVTARNVRLSYAHVLEPVSKLSGEGEEYNCSLIFDPDNETCAASLAAIEEALEAAAVTKFGPKAKSKLGKSLKYPVRDADAEGKDDPAYAGKKFMNVRSQRRPQIVDRDMMPVVDEEEVYSGCYANVSLSVFAYDTSGSKGVSAGLNNIQVVKKGPRLSGAADASEDFEALGDDDDLAELD
jgi:hypothetical protein